MSAPPPRPSKARCQAKRRHADELTARAAAASHLEAGSDRVKLYVYRCKHCDGWHLTKHWQPAPSVTAGDPYKEKRR